MIDEKSHAYTEYKFIIKTVKALQSNVKVYSNATGKEVLVPKSILKKPKKEYEKIISDLLWNGTLYSKSKEGQGMLRQAIDKVSEGKLVTLILKGEDGESLVPKNMKDNKGYPEYSGKKAKDINDLISGSGLEEEDGHLVLKEVGDQRVAYYTKRMKSNFKFLLKKDISVEVK